VTRKQAALLDPSQMRSLELERDFQERVVTLARLNGWRVYAVPDSRRATIAGYPDLTMWRGTRLVFAELKRERGRLSPAQVEVLAELKRTGNEVYEWRPRDWDAIVECLRRS